MPLADTLTNIAHEKAALLRQEAALRESLGAALAEFAAYQHARAQQPPAMPRPPATPAASSPHGNKAMLTTAEAAAYLNISKQTLEVWRVHGKGPKFVKIGNRVRYPLEVLTQYIETNMHEHTSGY